MLMIEYNEYYTASKGRIEGRKNSPIVISLRLHTSDYFLFDDELILSQSHSIPSPTPSPETALLGLGCHDG